MEIFKDKQGNKGGKRPQKKGLLPPGGPKQQFFINIVNAILIFLIIATVYSAITERSVKIEEIPISQVAKDINAGLVDKVTVETEDLKVHYRDDTERKSKKESESALSQTLSTYGVTPEKLAEVNIEVKSPSGLGFWLVNIFCGKSKNPCRGHKKS